MERILVADDEQPIVQFLAEVLRRKGYTVDIASNGAEAFEMAKFLRPHLVLLDIRMPGMDGLEALRRIMAVDPIVRVIVVTAVRDQSVAEEVLKMGAVDYITKPFELERLSTAVAGALNPLPG